jgi:hypothetical protein
MLFNPEVLCYPASYPSYKCPIIQGHNFTGETESFTCLNQRLIADKQNKKGLIYLNSGVFVGSVRRISALYDYISDILVDLRRSCRRGDQYVIGWIYSQQVLPVKLDFDEILITTMFSRDNEFQFNQQNGKYETTATGHSPYLLHFNGNRSKYRVIARHVIKWHVEKTSFDIFNE